MLSSGLGPTTACPAWAMVCPTFGSGMTQLPRARLAPTGRVSRLERFLEGLGTCVDGYGALARVASGGRSFLVERGQEFRFRCRVEGREHFGRQHLDVRIADGLPDQVIGHGGHLAKHFLDLRLLLRE